MIRSKLNYKTPTKFQTFLNNNIIVVSEELEFAESYALGFFFEVGSRDEIIQNNGIAHFIEHCAFRKTSKLNSKQIATRFESFGAYANAFTTQESTCFYVRALKNNFIPVFKLLGEISLDTVFDESGIEKERQIIIEEIKSYDDDPEESIFDYGDNLIFGDHPMGRSILGSEDSLNNINIVKLIEFHNKYYKKGKLVISYSGPHQHKFLIETISKYLFKPDFDPTFALSRIKPDIIKVNSIEVEKAVSQSHILMGSRIPGFDEDNKYVMPLFNILFGDGMSSRLYQNLRDKFGIAYSIYSTLQIHSDCGVFYIYAATDNKKLKRTQQLINIEIEKLLNKSIAKKELLRAKEQLKTSLIMELESLSSRMQTLAKNVLMNTDFEEINHTLELIDSIEESEIKEFLSKYISPENLSVVRMIGTN